MTHDTYMNHLAASFFVALSLLCLSQTQAATSQFYIEQAQQRQLHYDVTWQRLMYAEGRKSSEVVYDGYFYHTNGRNDLSQELAANIAQLFEPATENASIRCQFPARSQYLIRQLKIPQHELVDVSCPQLDAWLKEIRPQKTVFVYATDFMGNPSSMFGHTLLRFDPEQDKQLNLVSYAVNYAATVQGGQSWAYAWKGLTGQYPGEYSLMPYYQKVKEYGDFESRDLWEYELNLTEDESQFLLKHLWEMQQVSFPYYFVSDNCAYRLLGLIDLIKPELNLKQKFQGATIPVETMKALADAGLFKDVVYRPALETQLLAQAKTHGYPLAQQARKITALSPEEIPQFLTAWSADEQAKILEMAYDHLYLQHLAQKVDAKTAQVQLRKLLVLRSYLNIPKQRPMMQKPSFEPIVGHHARKVSTHIAQIQKQTVFELNARQAYHDVRDPIQGYRLGTQLKFLDLTVQLRPDRVKLAELDLLSVNSYAPITAFKAPLSWGFQLGWQQAAQHQGQFNPNHQHGVANMNTQFGYSWMNAAENNICFVQMQAHLQAGQSLNDGWRMGLGPKLGCQTVWFDRVSSWLELNMPLWHDSQQWQIQPHLHLQYQIQPQHMLAFGYELEYQNTQHWQGMRLGYSWFY